MKSGCLFPKSAFVCRVALAWLAAVLPLAAAGMVAIKEKPYHTDESAVTMPFTNIIDSGGPYIKIVADGKETNITRSMLVARIDLIGEVPPEIRTDRAITPVRNCLADMKSFAARFPAGRPALEPRIRSLEEHVRNFEAGKVRHGGRWIAAFDSAMIQAKEQAGREAVAQEPAVEEDAESGLSPVPDLGALIAVLVKPGMEEARQAVANLDRLAARQELAARMRTQRLASAIRNLFAAEFRLRNAEKARATAEAEAAKQRKSAEEWSKPNKFGSVNDVPAAEARQKAADILRRAGHHVAEHQKDLLAQLEEAESVLDDFRKTGDNRVALILSGAAQAIRSRSLPESVMAPEDPFAAGDEASAVLPQGTP